MDRLIRLVKVIACFSNWHTFLLDYFGLIRKKKIIYKLRRGVRFYARPNSHDKFVIAEVWSSQAYNPPGFEIDEEDTVLDVGAYIGDFTVYAAKMAKGGRVLAIEPFPQNFKILVENVKLNSLNNVTVVNKALSNINGEENINIAKLNTGGHTTVSEYLSGERIKVKSISLQKLLTNYKISRVDYMKMDCEGAEYKILLNSPRSVLKKIRKIAMEYHYVDEKRNAEVLTKYLKNNGFTIAMVSKNPPYIYAYSKEI